MRIKGCVGQFKEAQVQWQGQMGQIKSLTSSHSRGATSSMEEAQWNAGFCAKILTKEAQMHPKENDTLAILRFVSAKESTQIFGAILPECLTSPMMKESKAYKTYSGYAAVFVPPKMALKFYRKLLTSKIGSDLVPID
ncbi:hypothetical protein Tco_0611666 [Tanacetum coccineum]